MSSLMPEIAQRALAQALGSEGQIGDAISAVEGEARHLGAEEVYMAAACDLDRDHRVLDLLQGGQDCFEPPEL